MKKCDIIIPVYKSPEWVKLCVYSIFKNTRDEILNKVYLINDCDDYLTNNCLKNLKNKYGKKIEIIKNEKNLGFIGSTNKGLEKSTADYALLLNTDCILSKNAIEKMINNIKDDDTIGLVCPISSNAANLSLEMFPGFNYNDMNSLLEKKFKGILFDACTVVGNCLLITKRCLKEVGLLDTAYGLGYGEETDYQFSAMAKGFKAKVSIDTYVFHKAEVSFGVSKEKQERLNKNRDLFFERWGKEYNKAYALYEKNDPIKYILNNITDDDKKIVLDSVFYLDGIVQNAGGVHVTVDIVNYLAINNKAVNIAYGIMGDYKEIMLFNPISIDTIEKYKVNKIVATIWASTYYARVIADKLKCKLLYFVQGYETLFENGAAYGLVTTSYKLVDSVLTISNYLKDELKNTHNVESTLINNGINIDLLLDSNKKTSNKTITMILRNSPMKGDWILCDIIKKIDCQLKGYNINVIYMNEYIEFPDVVNNKLNLYLGPISRKDIIDILQKSDIYIDASLNEGFGLTPLEAMACGNVVIASNSLGNKDYIKNGKNGIIINKVNDSNEYVNALSSIVSDNEKFKALRNNAIETSKKFDIDIVTEKYIDYFCNTKFKSKHIQLNKREKELFKLRTTKKKIKSVTKKRKIYYIARLIPKCIKTKMKKVITYLYNCYSH